MRFRAVSSGFLKYAVAAVVAAAIGGSAATFAAQAQSPAPDWSGTYVVVLKSTGPDGDAKEDSGLIQIKQDGAMLVVSAGPSGEQQFPATKVVRSGEALSFEVAPPGDAPHVIRFELTIKERQLSGKGTMVRADGETRTAVVEGLRQ